MSLVASGKSGTIGKYLDSSVLSLNQRLNDLDVNALNIEKNDTYIHMAGMVGPKLVSDYPVESRLINVESTLRLAEHCLNIGAKRFIFISTSHVYAPGSEDKHENSNLEPMNKYAEQKLEAELELKRMYSENIEKLLILRIFSILDWDVKPFTLGGAISKVLQDPNYIISNGDDLRDFLTPQQAASAISNIAEINPEETTLNVCTGEPLSISQAANLMLLSKLGSERETQIERGSSTVPRLVGNPIMLKNATGMSLRWKYLEL